MICHKIPVTLIFLTAVAAAQTLPGSYPARMADVRAKFNALDTTEKDIPCNAPAATVNQHPRLVAFCASLINLLDPNRDARAFSLYVLQQNDRSLFLSFLADAADARLDVHNGSGAGGAGTTNAVVRAGLVDVLGAALEAGAITQSLSGSTLSLQGNALGLYRFITDPDDMFQTPQTTFESVLNNLSGTAALNLTSPSSQTVTGTVAGSGTTAGSAPVSAAALIQKSVTHLTGFTVRYQLFNRLDLRSDLYIKNWKAAFADKALLDKAKALDQQLAATFTGRADDRNDYNAWLAAAQAEITQALKGGATDISSTVASNLDKLMKTVSTDKVKMFLHVSNLYLAARDMALAGVRQQTVNGVTLEYVYARPTSQPRTSTARLVYTLRPGTRGSGTVPNDSAITFNFASDFYNNPPPGTGFLRDLQVGLQLDRHFGSTVGTLAGYYQYQHEKAALNIGPGNLAPNTPIVLPGPAATLLAPKGNLVVAQAKVTFALKNGTKLPVGVTWSNRTELIKANEVRGHVGFDFDWSSLLAANKAR